MNAVIFIAVFFSSIVGFQVFGISANKLALIPLELFLIVKLSRKKRGWFVSRKTYPVLLWYGLTILSSVSGLIFLTFYGDALLGAALGAGISNLVQILVIYVPIVLLLSEYQEQGADVKESVYRALVLTARIQCGWALAQMALYYTAHFDLNGTVLNDMLGQSGAWTVYSNVLGEGILLRPTGLNHDAAFLGFILLLGVILDANRIWKVAYVFAILMAFSRSALVTVVCLVVYELVCAIPRRRGNPGKTSKAVVVTTVEIAAVLAVLAAVVSIPAVQEQIARMNYRMDFSGADVGTGRHAAYPALALEVLFFRYPVLQKLFGIGIDISGTALSVYHPYLDIELTKTMMSGVWAVECDFAGALLGTGIIGSIAYYSMFVLAYAGNRDRKTRSIVFSLLIYGFMYNYAWLSIFQILLWAMMIGRDAKEPAAAVHGPDGSRDLHRFPAGDGSRDPRGGWSGQ